MSGLSQLHGINSKGEFTVALIQGLGANLDLEKRANFARGVYNWTGENPLDRKHPLNSYFDSKVMMFRSYDTDTVPEVSLNQL